MVKELPTDKAPGIDRFQSEFFQKYWEVIGDEATWAIQQLFENEKLLKEINCTIITLLPKLPCPSYVKDFRPYFLLLYYLQDYCKTPYQHAQEGSKLLG